MIDIDGNRHGHRSRDGCGALRLGVFRFGGKAHEECLGETTNLGTDDGLRALIPENHIRKGHFFLNRELGGENGFDQIILKPTASLEPLDLGGAKPVKRSSGCSPSTSPLRPAR